MLYVKLDKSAVETFEIIKKAFEDEEMGRLTTITVEISNITKTRC